MITMVVRTSTKRGKRSIRSSRTSGAQRDCRTDMHDTTMTVLQRVSEASWSNALQALTAADNLGLPPQSLELRSFVDRCKGVLTEPSALMNGSWAEPDGVH